MKKRMVLIAGMLLSSSALANKPNVLFIAVDDLNHWVEPLGRNPQAKTPNIQRLADMGVTFVNAQCAVPACNPSRGAIMGGRRPWVSGLYMNKTGKWTDFQKPGEGLSAQFLKAGYYVAGTGKVYHGMSYHPEEWSEYLDNSPYSLNGPGVEKKGESNEEEHTNTECHHLDLDYIAGRYKRIRPERRI
jgi:arylsulfatase A-like enzyme